MSLPFEDLPVFIIPEIKAIDLQCSSDLQFLIIVNKSDFDLHLDLLNAIKKAFAFEDDVNGKVIVLDDGEVINLSALYNQNKYEMALLFHVPTKKVGLNISGRKNKIIKTENFDIIYTDTLTNLNDNNERKRSLWNCLSNYKPTS